VARQLHTLGFDAAALLGGYDAWRAKHPIEAKGETSLQPGAVADAAF
jgi:hypothetical protein